MTVVVMAAVDLYPRINALLAEGRSQKEAARALGVSESTVSRVLADYADDAGFRPAQDAVDAFAVSLGADLPAAERARLEALRSIARKMDWTGRANTGTAAMAAASLAREFRNLLDELRQSASFDELREALLDAGD